MRIETKTTIGEVNYIFHIEENSDIEAMHKAIVLSNPPKKCNECQNNQYFKLDSNKDKDGNVYVNVVCRKCGAKAKLGLYKSGGFFWHKFEKYVKPGTEQKPEPPVEQPENNGLPF